MNIAAIISLALEQAVNLSEILKSLFNYQEGNISEEDVRAELQTLVDEAAGIKAKHLAILAEIENGPLGDTDPAIRLTPPADEDD